jgi:hypothetical protein
MSYELRVMNSELNAMRFALCPLRNVAEGRRLIWQRKFIQS